MTPSSVSNVNVTISVPYGSTNHGNPHLLCTPPGWTDFIIFFFSNYFAHVVTIITTPGQQWLETFEVITFALLLPMSGLTRACGAITRHAATVRDPVKRAARAGALCMVARNSVRDNKADRKWWNAQSTTTQGLPIVSERTADVNGQFRLSPGYFLMRVPFDAPVSVPDGIENGTSYTLASDYSLPRLVFGALQAAWAIITLYRSRGNQIEVYGYAAFGLTVAQYACMSVVNSIGNMLTPNYASMYLIRTPLMDEAEKDGCYFSGEIDVRMDDSTKSFDDLLSSDNDKLFVEFCLGFIIGLAPLAITGGLSRFQKRQSTAIERGFTIAWLVMSIVIGPIVRVVHIGIVEETNQGEDPNHETTWIRIGLSFLFILAFGAPAIGGMVVVGLMIRDFGICNLIS